MTLFIVFILLLPVNLSMDPAPNPLETRLFRAEKMLAVLGFNVDKPFYSKQVVITSYTSRVQETDNTPYITANNTYVRPGGIAVSKDLFTLLGGFGSRVTLLNYGNFIVNDIMNSRYKNSVDIWCGDLTAARKHGRRKGTLLWQ